MHRLAVGPLPNFLIVGATRSGTSSLHHYLGEHPDVFVPPAKELSFFDHDRNYFQELSAYRRHFCGWRGQHAVGEASPMYWLHGMIRDERGQHRYSAVDDAGSRMAAALPAAKTIISLRDPVRRAYSQFWRNRWRGREHAPTFLEALGEEQRGVRGPERGRTCWIYHNRYALHLRRWYELFPRDQVKVLVFEEWTQQPEEAFRELCEFLNVDPGFTLPEFASRNEGWQPRSQWWARRISPWLASVPGLRRLDNWNRSTGYTPLSHDVYVQARDFFAREIMELESLLGRNLDAWQFSK